MKTIKILTKTDVKDIVINELKQKNKIISKGEVEAIVNYEIRKKNKDIYRIINKLRKKILELERKTKTPKIKLPLRNRK